MLKLAERILVTAQNFTGIPRWKWLAGAWRMSAVLIALRVLVENRSRFFFAFAVVIALGSLDGEGKDEQRLADRARMIVINPKRQSWWRVLARVLCAISVITYLVAGNGLAVTENLAFLIAWLLTCANTFPMQSGSGIKSLLKRLRSLRRTEVATSET